MDAPFEITVWSGDMGTRHGWIGDPLSVKVTERHNAVSTGEVVVPASHRLISTLITPGTRLCVDYGARRVLSGPIRGVKGEGPSSSGDVTLAVEGDWRLFHRVLGWPVPGNAITNQNVAYYTASGAAETVLKGIVTANAVTRLGLPVTVATNLARGSSIKVTSRMHPLADRLFPAVEDAGLGVSVVQDDASGTLLVDVYEPATYPRTLTEDGGTVLDWSWSLAGPGATRVIVGDGSGEGTSRVFASQVDSSRESAWVDRIEVFRDARDTTDTDTVNQRKAEALADGAPTSGLKVTLAETSVFKYGVPGGVAVGDVVSLEVGPGVVITDVLREAVLSWTAADGFSVEPVIGERADDPSTATARSIAALARAVKNLLAGR